LDKNLDKDLETKPLQMFLVGSAILMYLSTTVMYDLELILFNPAMLPVGSAIVGECLQLFLATLN
jgi:hypothetical protein